MPIFTVLIVFLQASLFTLFQLNIRKLEEKGISARAIAGLHRWAIIPSLLLLALTYKKEYATLILSHPQALWWILGIGFFWGIGQFMGYIVLNSSSSLTFVYALGAFIELPIYLAIGILINHDLPNIFSLVAIALMILAVMIRPTQDTSNKRTLLKYSVPIMIAIIIANIIGHALDGAFYRNLMVLLTPAIPFGIAIYTVMSTLVITIIYFLPIFKPIAPEEKETIKKYKWMAYSIPVLWFLGSLPEGYSFAHIPLFTLSVLASFGFLLKLASDLKNKRVASNMRTAIFVLCVITSIVLSTISLNK